MSYSDDISGTRKDRIKYLFHNLNLNEPIIFTIKNNESKDDLYEIVLT